MKRKIESEIDKNRHIWEEFVSKNNIRKKSISDRDAKNKKQSSKIFSNQNFLRQQRKPSSFEDLPKNHHTNRLPKNEVFRKIDNNVDKNQLRKIKIGKIVIEGRLDLHGFSLREAESQLKFFVGESYRLKKRLLLVITGKGRNSKPDINGLTRTIKGELDIWLSNLFYQERIQYISKALEKHGGNGAYYFFLKRSKNIFS